jgi:hypothetical protein
MFLPVAQGGGGGGEFQDGEAEEGDGRQRQQQAEGQIGAQGGQRDKGECDRAGPEGEADAIKAAATVDGGGALFSGLNKAGAGMGEQRRFDQGAGAGEGPDPRAEERREKRAVTVKPCGAGGEDKDIAVALPPGQERVAQGEGRAKAVQEQWVGRFAQRIDGKREVKLAGQVGPWGGIGQSGQVWCWRGWFWRSGSRGWRGQDLREGEIAESRIGSGEKGNMCIGEACG